MALSLRDNDERLLKINYYVTLLQYTIFMIIFQSLFTAISIALIPFAWIVGTIDKSKAIRHTDTTKDIVYNFVLFAFFGPFILVLDTLVDSYYFWQVMF